MTNNIHTISKAKSKEDEVAILLNKINSLLELALNCEPSFYTRPHWHDYLYVLSDLFNQLEDEIGGVSK